MKSEMSSLQKEIDCRVIVAAVRSCLSKDRDQFPLHEPTFRGNEWQYVKDCLDSGWVSSVGAYVNRFEKMITDIVGTKHAIAVVNGTAALHMALMLVGVESGDEVLVPALTFVSPVNAIRYCGGIPHFVDSEETTLGVDCKKLEKWLAEIAVIQNSTCLNRKSGRPIKALVVVHVLGHPVDLDGAKDICNRYSLKLVEDAAESLGSFYKKQHTGNWGVVSTLSFNGNKTVTTGGGGAILTGNDHLAARARHITTTAKVPHRWNYFHDVIGFNYRMPNLNAALGCAQLEQLEDFLSRKRNLAERYRHALAGIQGVRFFLEPSFAHSNYWLNALLLERPSMKDRDNLLLELAESGLQSRPAWTLMHRLPMNQDCPRMDLSGSEALEASMVQIPSGAAL